MFAIGISPRAAFGLGLLALPGAAHAGTTTATGTAVLNVINQCSVTGATVSLGTYAASNTLADIAADLGDRQAAYTPGKRGQEYLNWGSITCDAGAAYSLTIRGTSVQASSPGGIRFAWQDGQSNNYVAVFDIFVRKIGGATVADSDAGTPGAGANVNRSPAAGIGTGSPQVIQGSVAFNYDASMSQYFDQLQPGTLSDLLSYTLNF